jgi:hypothetical protein
MGWTTWPFPVKAEPPHSSSFPRQVSHMYMTRQGARSSFTVEIKRANKRPIESSKVASATGNELVERVFGSLLGSADSFKAPEPLAATRSQAPRPHPAPPEEPASGLTDQPPRQPARRVLPDLLAPDVNPIAERMRQQAEQRTARRRAALESRRSTAKGENQQAERNLAPMVAEPVIAPVRDGPVASVQPPTRGTDAAMTSEKRKQNARPSILKKGRRSGQRDRLPAGERWKRRLPRACW